MSNEVSLPDLDKLHAEATPGEWVQSSYALEVQRNDGAVADVGEFDRTHDARWTAAAHNTWPTISARLKEQDESIAELKADRRALVHEIRRYASYMLQLTEEFAVDDIERYQRAMDRAHEMQRKSDDEARANPEEFEANVEQVAKATRELRR